MPTNDRSKRQQEPDDDREPLSGRQSDRDVDSEDESDEFVTDAELEAREANASPQDEEEE